MIAAVLLFCTFSYYIIPLLKKEKFILHSLLHALASRHTAACLTVHSEV